MKVDGEKLKSGLLHMLQHIVAVETELLVYKSIVTTLLELKTVPHLADRLHEAETDPTIGEAVARKWSSLRETIEKNYRGGPSVEDFLEKWKPSGPIN